MKKEIRATDCKIIGNLVKIYYDDGTEVFIKKEDYERAAGPIASGEKESIIRDFGLITSDRQHEMFVKMISFIKDIVDCTEEKDIFSNLGFTDKEIESFDFLIEQIKS